MWRLCSIAIVCTHGETVTKCNLGYSSAELLFNQLFHIFCLHHWFLFPLWICLSEFLTADFTSFFQWVKCILNSVLSLWNSAVLPDLDRQYFINILSFPLSMLVVVKMLNRAGPGQPVWDLPFTCLLRVTLSVQNVRIPTHTVQMCSDRVQRWNWNLT